MTDKKTRPVAEKKTIKGKQIAKTSGQEQKTTEAPNTADSRRDHEEEVNKKTDEASSEKKEAPKSKEDKIVLEKKDVAVARGRSYPISRKQAQYVCAFLKGKGIDRALADLAAVQKLKRVVPFKGEIPHRKGRRMSGRFPVKAAGYFVNVVKALRGNILVNQMDLDASRITLATASGAHRPSRRGGREGKRTHVMLEAREVVKPKAKEKRDIKEIGGGKK